MTPGRHTLLIGECREQMRSLAPGSVHCCVTSPPYWGLREYGIAPSEWADGWRGVLGLEETPEAFVAHIVEVFAEVRAAGESEGEDTQSTSEWTERVGF